MTLRDLKGFDEHSFDDSARGMLQVRSKDIACQIGTSAEIESALEHVTKIVEDLVIEANLPLVLLVFDATRALKNVVIVVRAVKSQLRVKIKQKNYVIAVSNHVIEAIYIDSIAVNERKKEGKKTSH